MIADLKPYADYKESGLPWIGQMPRHWALVPNRGLVRKRKVLVGKHHGDYRLLSLTKQGVIVRDISTGKGKFSSDMGTSQEVRNGDLVFCFFDVPETPRTVGLSRHDGMITGAYTVFESLRRDSAEYFELFYRAMDDRKLLSPLYSGLRNTIPAERFRGARTPQPPDDEQAAIVRFLDWANGRLERAIRAKRKVIALLNEQKQAIIHRAVTRGLDPSVPLKPSGIPWLGDIPQHWEVRKIRAVATRVTKGTTPTTLGKQFVDSGIRFVKVESISADRGILESKCAFIDDATDRLLSRSRLRAHDVVVSIAGAIGRPAIIAPSLLPANTNQAVGIISPLAHLCRPEWLTYILASPMCLRAMTDSSVQSAQANLSLASLGRTAIPLPRVHEQDLILASLSGEMASVSNAISRLEREIELLREYRTRLVADVVTGKLDVREAAARLPDEAPLDTVDNDADLVDETEAADEEASVA